MTTPDALSQPLFRTAPNYRTLASAIAVYLGGYLVIASVTGQLAYLLSGLAQNQLEVTALLVLQAAFAVLVVVAGLLLAAAPMAARLIASAIVIVVVLIVVSTQAITLTGSLGVSAITVRLTVGNGYFMALLAIGAAWLVVRRAGVGWLVLLATLIMIPVPYVFALYSIPAGISQILSLSLCLIIGAAIIVAGRPLRD